MSRLVLVLRPGEKLILNGAHLRFHTRARFELTTHARLVYGKQVMSPEEADTPARRFYLALQIAYVGTAAERPLALEAARKLASALKAATTSLVVRDAIDHTLTAAAADDGFAALKLARRIVQHEAAVLGRCDSTRQSNLGLEAAREAALSNSGAEARTTLGGA
jgi:flagellar protein FlbT